MRGCEITMCIDKIYARYGAYKPDPDRNALITDDLISELSQSTATSRSDIYDRIAVYLTTKFLGDQFDFGFCDLAMMDLESMILARDEVRSALFCDVYNAFDEGEYLHRNDDESVDPIEKYTRPMLREAMQKYSAAFAERG